MGSFFKSGKSTTTTTNPYSTNPYGPQEGNLQQGFEQNRLAADNAISQAASGNLHADMNATQMAGLQNIAGMAGAGTDASQAAMGIGMGNLAAGANYGNYANDIYGRALQDPTGQTINRAGQFADNPYMQGQIDSVISDSNRALGRGIADLNAGAAGTGNMNSSRAGAMEANLRNEAADRVAGVSSNMRGQAYNQGLNLGAQQYQGQFNNQLGANAQLGRGADQGLNQLQTGYGMGTQAGQNMLNAGEYVQNQQQQALNSQYLMPLQLGGQYMQNIGGNYGSYGDQTNTNVQKTPSGFNKVVGAASSIMGGLGSMGICHVARAVYGFDDDRWLAFRGWLYKESPMWFFRLYAKYGEVAANVVRKSPLIRRIVKSLMDKAIGSSWKMTIKE